MASCRRWADHKSDVIAHGLDSKFCIEAVEHFAKLLAWIVPASLKRDYLAGDEFSQCQPEIANLTAPVGE
jgi:hypothetical protein